MDKQEATKKISALTDEARAKIREAEKIADEAGISFGFSVAYGMGGSYIPEGQEEREWYDEWELDNGWVSSSRGC